LKSYGWLEGSVRFQGFRLKIECKIGRVILIRREERKYRRTLVCEIEIDEEKQLLLIRCEREEDGEGIGRNSTSE
jgi:ribosomal protein L34